LGVSLYRRSLLRHALRCGSITAALALSALGAGTGQPISDEVLRLVALRAIFAGMHVSVDEGKRIDNSSPAQPKAGDVVFPDGLAKETVYRVIGEARNGAEKCASEDAFNRKSSTTRRVRFRLFGWPNWGGGGMVVALQYDFPGVNPANSCSSIGLLVQLKRTGEHWAVCDQYLLETAHHESLQRAELLDLVGDGVADLVVESNYGSAGMVGSSLRVFDLRRGQFEELLDVDSRSEFWGQSSYTQVLNIERTRQSGAQQFCFTKADLLLAGKPRQTPRVTAPCYEIGEGVDLRSAGERNKTLEPVR
jgi:hypothetical protein